MNITYALSQWSFYFHAANFPLEDLFQSIRENGYGVELWAKWGDDNDTFAPENRSRLVKALDGMPVKRYVIDGDAFGRGPEDAMRRLRIQGLDELIPQLKQPLLGICLGILSSSYFATGCCFSYSARARLICTSVR